MSKRKTPKRRRKAVKPSEKPAVIQTAAAPAASSKRTESLSAEGRLRRRTLLGGLFAGLFAAVRPAKAEDCGCLPAPDCTTICPNGGSPRADGTQACDCNPDPLKPRALSTVDGGDAVNSTGWNGWIMRLQHNLTSTKLAVFDEDSKSLDYVETSEVKYQHPDSGIEPGTYTSVTVDKQGHVTAGSNSAALIAYPVGSVYISLNAANPGTLFGGVWESIGEGRVLIAACAKYPAGTKGGEESHKLTVSEMPSHTHSGSSSSAGSHSHTRGTMNVTGHFEGYEMGRSDGFTASGAFYLGGASSYKGSSDNNKRAPIVMFDASRTWTGSTSTSGYHSHTMDLNYTGGSAAHNNMQPYLACHIWKRVS